MSEQPTTAQQKQRPERGERVPIRIKRLMLHSDKPTMMGLRLPQGDKGEEQRHDLLAGIQGQDKTEIEYRPWLRAFRIARYRRQTSTGPRGEVEAWIPFGSPFFLHESWAVWIPEDDA